MHGQTQIKSILFHAFMICRSGRHWARGIGRYLDITTDFVLSCFYVKNYRRGGDNVEHLTVFNQREFVLQRNTLSLLYLAPYHWSVHRPFCIEARQHSPLFISDANLCPLILFQCIGVLIKFLLIILKQGAGKF